MTLAVDQAPELGASAISYRFGPPTPPSDNPWLEQRSTAVLLSDPNESVALVVSVGAVTIHDPAGADVTELDDAEYERIVEAAVGRILDGL